jgi:two-component system cell cycle sensor histidine kinase/response regulator CckA
MSLGRVMVLVVDDDERVRWSVKLVLEERGYDVLEAGSAQTALSAVTALGDRIDLVLTDVAMPGMSGFELAALLRGLGWARVLFMSGESSASLRRLPNLPQGAHILEKPLDADDLERAILAALPSGAAVAPECGRRSGS